MRKLPLTLADVLQRQTAENSRIYLDLRPHLEKMKKDGLEKSAKKKKEYGKRYKVMSIMKERT